MPPVFGIIQTEHHCPDPLGVIRMKQAATYMVPRRLDTLEWSSGCFFAALIGHKKADETGKFLYQEGDFIIAADGTLFKWKELLRKLGFGNSDIQPGAAELILKSFLRWGKDCVRHLYGDFAFVIVNIKSGNIFCGRDPAGVRPFFYGLHLNSFIFGSELRQVLAFYDTLPPLRNEYLLDSLVTVKTKRDLAPYEGIYRLKPGHTLRVSANEVKEEPYWNPDPCRTIRLKQENDYIEILREDLINAVDMRCREVSVIGSELSGGLDSAAVTGIAAMTACGTGSQLYSFSNVFPTGTDITFTDEREWIDRMLEFKEMEWTGVDYLGMTIAELLEQTIKLQGCFVQQHYHIFNRGIYEAAGKKGAEVLLSGFGGDEMVSARISVPWNEMIREGQWRHMADELYHKGITLRSLIKPGKLAFNYLLSFTHKPESRSGIFTPEFLDRRFASLPLQEDFARKNKLRERLAKKYRLPYFAELSARQLNRIRMDHVPQRMEYCYAAAAQFGVEYRYPLLDQNLIETFMALPPWLKQHHGTNRYLFRAAIKNLVPETIRQRDDKSLSTIPQVYFSLVNEKESIMERIRHCSGSAYLNEIFDFSRFGQWYGKIVRRDEQESNYSMPGAFYDYLMIMLYFNH